MASSFKVHGRISTVDKDGNEIVLEEGGSFSLDEVPMSRVAIEHLVASGELEPVETKAANRPAASKE